MKKSIRMISFCIRQRFPNNVWIGHDFLRFRFFSLLLLFFFSSSFIFDTKANPRNEMAEEGGILVPDSEIEAQVILPRQSIFYLIDSTFLRPDTAYELRISYPASVSGERNGEINGIRLLRGLPFKNK